MFFNYFFFYRRADSPPFLHIFPHIFSDRGKTERVPDRDGTTVPEIKPSATQGDLYTGRHLAALHSTALHSKIIKLPHQNESSLSTFPTSFIKLSHQT